VDKQKLEKKIPNRRGGMLARQKERVQEVRTLTVPIWQVGSRTAGGEWKLRHRSEDGVLTEMGRSEKEEKKQKRRSIQIVVWLQHLELDHVN